MIRLVHEKNKYMGNLSLSFCSIRKMAAYYSDAWLSCHNMSPTVKFPYNLYCVFLLCLTQAQERVRETDLILHDCTVDCFLSVK